MGIMTQSEKILISKDAAAAMLSVSLRTIDNLVRAKELRPRKLGRRVLFERRELERFARSDHATGEARGGPSGGD